MIDGCTSKFSFKIETEFGELVDGYDNFWQIM